MDKQFSFETPAKKGEHLGYKNRILSVINEVERRVRVVMPDESLHRELHEKRALDTRHEVKEFEKIRRDVCETFGVPYNEDHVYIYDPHRGNVGPKEQRALRCFFVLIDTLKGEGFYGEGRTVHNVLLNKLTEKITERDSAITYEEILQGINKNPPSFIVFKGFLSTKEFREISDGSRQVLETPLFDERGAKIQTAEDWFVSGHNLEEMFPPSPEPGVQKVDEKSI